MREDTQAVLAAPTPRPAALPAPESAGRAPFTLLAAVFLVTASGLMFELTLTRIFSATIWYHYTFVAISVALFGWGLGGFVVFLAGLGRFRALHTHLLVTLSLLLALALPLFPYGIIQYPFTPERLNYYFVLSLLPFLVGGAMLSLAFESCGADSNRLYFADLIGAATGVALVPMTLSLLGAETAVLAIAALPAAAALLLSLGLAGAARGVGAALSAVALLAAGGLAAWNHASGVLTIRDAPEKGLYKLLHEAPQARITSDRWNAYSRISSVAGFDDFHLERLYIDSDAWTNVLRWDGTLDTPAGARDWFRALPFRLAPEPKVLVIGPGGGTDVVMAICAGSPQVTAVEMNPLIVDCVRRLGDAAGRLYDHPKVRLVEQEGRSFIERTPEKFDLIVLGFVDSWAAVASGGLSLTENYLYTRDALEAYYDHLTDRGALVIIRWPVDVRRLVANSVDFLSRRGLATRDIAQRIFAVSERPPRGDEPIETVFMLCKSPLDEAAAARMLAGHEKAHVIFSPCREIVGRWEGGKVGRETPAATTRSADADAAAATTPNDASSAPLPTFPSSHLPTGTPFPGDAPFVRLLSGLSTPAEFGQAFDTLATPVHDDRPFYFATDKPNGIPGFVVRLFQTPLRAVLVFVALLVVAGWWMGLRIPGPRAFAYFGALGVGFIICEIALLQRLILLLGHPIYTLVVLLLTLLVAGGVGSLLARRIETQRIRAALGWIIPGVVVLVLLAAFGLPAVVRAALPLDLPLRVAIAAAMVFPFGLLMGMPFPLGLRRYATTPGAAPVSTLWGINGVSSVIGSMAGVLLAVVGGFTTVLVVGAGCYVLALAARPR